MRIFTLFALLGLSAAIAFGQSAVNVRDTGYAPVEVIADVLGAPAVTDPATHEITLTAATTKVIIIPYVPFMLQKSGDNVVPIIYDFSTPFLWQGKTMAPLRTLASALGFTIQWDDGVQQVTLTNTASGHTRMIPIAAYDAVQDLSAMYTAIKAGKLDDVRTLLQRDPALLTLGGSDLEAHPLSMAVDEGQNTLVQYLLDHDAGYATPPSWPLAWDPPAEALCNAASQGKTSIVDLLAKRSYYTRMALFTGFPQRRKEGFYQQCVEDQQQLALDIQAYIQNNEMTFPDAHAWVAALKLTSLPDNAPVAMRLLLHCGDRPDLTIAYGYNAHLSNRLLATLKDPTETVVTADCSNTNHLLFSEDDIDWARRPNGAVVSFADGHVKTVKRDPLHPLHFADDGWDPALADLTPGTVIPAPPPPPANVDLIKAISTGKVDDVRALITAHPAALTTNLSDDVPWQPLTYACASGQREVVALLLQIGATPKYWDFSMAAVVAGAPDIVKMLMKAQTAKP